jgi:hypothetical protein
MSRRANQILICAQNDPPFNAVRNRHFARILRPQPDYSTSLRQPRACEIEEKPIFFHFFPLDFRPPTLLYISSLLAGVMLRRQLHCHPDCRQIKGEGAKKSEGDASAKSPSPLQLFPKCRTVLTDWCRPHPHIGTRMSPRPRAGQMRPMSRQTIRLITQFLRRLSSRSRLLGGTPLSRSAQTRNAKPAKGENTRKR